MISKLAICQLALALLLLSSPTAQGAPGQPQRLAGDMDCHIRATPGPGMLKLEAVARSDQTLSGTYHLAVKKQSSSGVSQNVQSGPFAVNPGRDQVLTTVVLDRSADLTYSANLSLKWDRGSISCSSP
jgi:hypothetical protein